MPLYVFSLPLSPSLSLSPPTIIHCYQVSYEILEQQIQCLEDQFKEIVSQTFDKIKEKNPDVSKFRQCLTNISIKYQKHHKEFFMQLLDNIEKDKTIDHVWIRLSGYWNFLNYTLLENLIHEFGDRTLKTDMDEYIKCLKKFRSATRVCDFAKYCTEINEDLSEQDLKDFVVKLDQHWDKCTLEDLERLKKCISQKFFLPSFMMSIKDIQPGSIIVTWTLPTLIASAIMELLETTSVRDFCNKNGIQSISIDTKECKYSPSKDYEAYEAFLKDINFTLEGKKFDVSKLAPIIEKYKCGDVHVYSSGSVTVLPVSTWSPIDYYSLGYALSNSPSKWELHFSYSTMGNKEIKKMCKGMSESMEALEAGDEIHAFFNSGSISLKGLKWFVKIPHYLLQRIVSLDFSYNKLDKKALNLLSQVIPALSRLEVLFLSDNPIGKGGAVKLMKALSYYKTPLKKLGLQRTSIGKNDIRVLHEVLADNHVEELAIDGPTISIMTHYVETIRVEILSVCPPMSVDSCTSLASLLKHCTCQLKELDISVCSINSDGAVQIAAGLSQNESVMKVSMQENSDIGDVGAVAFGDMLRKNMVLQELNLVHCGITSQGCDGLAKRINSTLQVLDLSWNRLGEEGVDSLLTSLRSNTTLTRLILPQVYERLADLRVEWRGAPV